MPTEDDIRRAMAGAKAAGYVEGGEPLEPPFDRALELCVALSEDEASQPNWLATLREAQGFARRGHALADEEIRHQMVTLLTWMLLAQLGSSLQPALVRELERRADTMRVVRADPDAVWVQSDDAIEAVVHTIRVALRVGRAFEPPSTEPGGKLNG